MYVVVRRLRGAMAAPGRQLEQGHGFLALLSSRWVIWMQVGAAMLILAVGLVLTPNAWRNLAAIG